MISMKASKKNPYGIKIPELVAPAGNMSSAITAFEFGADAIYAGLKKFNARERTENFTLEEMEKLVRYAHLNNKKVYVTFNTLIKESDILQVAEALSELARIRPDAVIVQDIGVIYIIKNYFPELAIHASTQMAIHNSSGVKIAESLGVRRVILERQLTFSELEQIAKKSLLELEVFVHGAICCSFSGECLFSSWMGGWSGNRGKCKQPCRHKYFIDTGSGPGKSGFYFSTKDLCLIRHIPFLKKIGVSAIKIEGRLRRPDYIKNIVSAYRLVLDVSPQNERAAIKEAEQFIEMSYGRNFIHGFSGSSSFKEVILPDESGVSGDLCGKITGIKNDGFYVKVFKKLHVGDRIRIQLTSGRKATSLTVSKMSVTGKPVMRANCGQICFIHTQREINRGGDVYKIGEDIGDLSSKIKNIILTNPTRLDLLIEIKASGLEIIVRHNTEILKWRKEMKIAEAEKIPLSEEKISEEFSSTCNENFKTGGINVKIHGSFFIPLSVLKKIRREFWNWVGENVKPVDQKAKAGEKLEKFVNDFGKPGIINKNKVFTSTFSKDGIFKRDGIGALPVTLCEGKIFEDKKSVEAVLPVFCPEAEIVRLSKIIGKVYACGIRRFRVTSLYGLELLKKYKDIKVTVSYPLPICNSMAVCEIRRFGISQVQAWVELEECEIRSLIAKSALPVEIFHFGRVPLMITRAEVPVEGLIRDSHNNKFIVKKDKNAGIFYVYSDKALSFPHIENASEFFDLTNSELSEKSTSSFNFSGILA